MNENIIEFKEAVEKTRQESTGVSIANIAKCFIEVFDEAELEAFINELKKQ